MGNLTKSQTFSPELCEFGLKRAKLGPNRGNFIFNSRN